MSPAFKCLITLACLIVASDCQYRGSQDYHRQDHHEGHQHKRPHASKDGSLGDGVIFDKEHIYEDMKEAYNLDMDKGSMSDDELAFYYFQTHDFDKNSILDGLEILTAMNHILDDPNEQQDGSSSTTAAYDPENDGPVEEFYRLRSQKKWNEKFLEDSHFIDELLEKYDTDRDGYLSYPEYIRASRQGS